MAPVSAKVWKHTHHVWSSIAPLRICEITEIQTAQKRSVKESSMIQCVLVSQRVREPLWVAVIWFERLKKRNEDVFAWHACYTSTRPQAIKGVAYRQISSLTSNTQVSLLVNFSSLWTLLRSCNTRLQLPQPWECVRGPIGGAIWRRKEEPGKQGTYSTVDSL